MGVREGENSTAGATLHWHPQVSQIPLDSIGPG